MMRSRADSILATARVISVGMGGGDHLPRDQQWSVDHI